MNALYYFFFALFMLSVILGFWVLFWSLVVGVAILTFIYELRSLYAHVRFKPPVERKEENY